MICPVCNSNHVVVKTEQEKYSKKSILQFLGFKKDSQEKVRTIQIIFCENCGYREQV